MSSTVRHSGTPPDIAIRTRQLFDEHLRAITIRADRLFAWVTGFECVAGIVFALWISPRAWSSEFSRIHLHVWEAIVLGGLVAFLPMIQIVRHPGVALTRHVIAVSQMLLAGMLVHLTEGRIETHFAFLGLLAFLAFYRDWKVLCTATLVVGLDHLLRGAYWPLSVYGEMVASPWRTAEHMGWVVFEVMFLMDFIRQSRREALAVSERHAQLETVHAHIALEVAARTADLTIEIDERAKAETRLHLQNEVSAVVSGDQAREFVRPQTLRIIGERMGWKWGAVWEVSSHSLVMRMVECWSKSAESFHEFETISRSMVLRLGEGIPGKVWAAGDSYWIEELQPNAKALRVECARASGLRAAFAFPVLQEDEVVSVIEFYSDEIQKPDQDLLETFAAMGRTVGSYLARKQGERALRESERRYRLMFDDNPHPMWVYDLETLRFLAVNRSAVQKYGYSAEEFTGMTMLDIYPPSEARELLRRIPLLPSSDNHTQQLKHRTKDGRLIDVEITSHTVDWKSRPADLVLANDVTDREKAQSDRAMMEIQLRHAQKLESIGQLAAGIAHEINTPTQYIGDNARFLKDAFQDFTTLLERYDRLLKLAEVQTVPREVVERLAAEIHATDTDYLLREIPNAIQQSLEGVERVSTLVAAMKEFSHPGTKEKTPIDLNKSIESTITVARNEWKYVADLETHYDPALPLVSCLPGEFNQVILNLIVNAAHAIGAATEDGSRGKGMITVQTRDFSGWVEIRVQDTGTGIPQQIQTRIFDPFFTTKEIGRGTGQGLAIAYSVIVEKHGGTISFETAIGKGTTFKICLPHDGKTLPAKMVMA